MKPPGYFIKCKSTRVKINNFSVKCFIPESEILHSIRLVFTSYHKKKNKKKNQSCLATNSKTSMIHSLMS